MMKKTLITTCLFMHGLSLAFAQNMPLSFQSPLPSAHRYNDVQMINDLTAVAAGNMGAFIKSTDGGVTWAYTWTKTHVHLSGLDFPDINHGYAVGHASGMSPYTLVKTTDGGNNWDTLNMSGADLNDVDFVSPDTGWVVGTLGKIWKTTDGAQTWTDQSIGSSFSLTKVVMIDSLSGFAAGENGIFYATADGGNNWNLYNTGTAQTVLAMFWRNANEGWMSFTSGIIKKTINGGQTWTNCSFINGPFDVPSIHMKDSLNGIGATTQADIVRTTNGGLTWTGTNNFGNQPLAVSFYGNQNGVLAGYYGCIQRSTDGGSTLISAAAPYNYYDYNNIQFTDALNGFCVGEGGRILKTLNGGTTWTLLTPSVSSHLYDLSFVNPQTGWVVGVNGTIKKTSNGGSTFVSQSGVPANTDLLSVCFIDQNTGWVSGESSAMYKTTNGGNTWTPQTLPNFVNFVWQVNFVDANTGYATGASNGNLLKTSDGGTNWVALPQSMLGMGNIRYFQFFNADTGVATTTSWRFLKTTDGGITWTELANFCVGIPVMHFYDEWHGVISGDNTNFNCKMYETHDGGVTWTNTQVPFDPNINGLFMTDTNSIYMCGDDGSIANFGGIGTIITVQFPANGDDWFRVFPNPVSESLTISFNNVPVQASLEIFDVSGKSLLQKNLTGITEQIDIRELSKGMYMIRAEFNGQAGYQKIVVK